MFELLGVSYTQRCLPKIASQKWSKAHSWFAHFGKNNWDKYTSMISLNAFHLLRCEDVYIYIYTPCNWIHWASPDCWHHNLGLRMRCFKKYPTKNGTYWCFPSNSRFASENKKALVVTSNKLKSIVYPRHSSNHMSEWQSSMSSLNCCQMWCAKHIAKCLICSV